LTAETSRQVGHLRGLGFESVHNRNEDFYAVLSDGRTPPHDVVVTNPPYTGDHVERLLKFLAANGRPYLILMPSYFGDDGSGRGQAAGTARQRRNWLESLAPQRPIFLCPRERYQYCALEGVAAAAAAGAGASAVGRRGGPKTVPFISYWHIGLRPVLDHRLLLLPQSAVGCGGRNGAAGTAACCRVDERRKAEATPPLGEGAEVTGVPEQSGKSVKEEDGAQQQQHGGAQQAVALQLAAGSGLFGSVTAVARAGWGRGGWPHKGAWVSKKKRKLQGYT
jgi:hypothetical protein